MHRRFSKKVGILLNWGWGTYCDDRTMFVKFKHLFSTLNWQYWRTFVLVILKLLKLKNDKNKYPPILTFNPKILQSFISSQLTTQFCHIRPVCPQNCWPPFSGKCRSTFLICCNAEWAAMLKQMFLICRYYCSGCFKFLYLGGNFMTISGEAYLRHVDLYTSIQNNTTTNMYPLTL